MSKMNTGQFRVMHVVSNLEIGGGQETVRTLAQCTQEAGCATVVCTFKDGPLRPQIEQLGIPVEVLPERRYGVLAFPLFVAEMLRIRHALLQLVKKYAVNVVQTHLLRVLDFLVLTLRYRRNLLVFWTIQNSNFALREDHLRRHKWLLGPKRSAYRILYRIAARWGNGFIAVSDQVKSAIVETIGPIEDKITVICNSVDVARYRREVDRLRIRRELGLPDTACLMAVVATFKKQKGHRYLLEALPPVVSAFPNLRVLLIGDGKLREELQEQARSLALQEYVHFLGTRTDVADLLAASDCFVLPSLWEGLPMALVEAMASGLPVIATAVSGSIQVMVPGETGLLIPPADVRRLRDAMIQLLSDPFQARVMGAAARQRVEVFFSAKKQAAEHLALYCRASESSLRNCPSTLPVRS